jgi:hypothetical protein
LLGSSCMPRVRARNDCGKRRIRSCYRSTAAGSDGGACSRDCTATDDARRLGRRVRTQPAGGPPAHRAPGAAERFLDLRGRLRLAGASGMGQEVADEQRRADGQRHEVDRAPAKGSTDAPEAGLEVCDPHPSRRLRQAKSLEPLPHPPTLVATRRSVNQPMVERGA